MTGRWQDDPLVEQPTAVTPQNPVPRWAQDPEVAAPGNKYQPAQRDAVGALEHIQAGWQSSAPGLLWRGKLPELVMNPDTASWWERALTGFTSVGAEIPLMIPGAMVGAPTGAAIGGAITGPAAPVGTAVGGIMGGGAGMLIVPGGIRESLIQSYLAGETKDAADWWNIVRETAKAIVKEGAIGAATFSAGAVARGGAAALMGGGRQVAQEVGLGTATMSTRGAARVTVAADLAGQIATMGSIPGIIENRLPKFQEFLDAAILIGGMSAAVPIAHRMMNTYRRTGKTPAEQVADARADPKVAEELAAPEVEVPRGADGRIVMPTIQEALFREQARLSALEEKASGTPTRTVTDDFGELVTIEGRPAEQMTPAERAELKALRARVEALEGMNRALDPVTPEEPTYTPDQAAQARALATERSAALAARTDALTDAERAERVFLTTATPEALAKHFKLEPAGYSRKAAEDSAQVVHDDVLRQLRDADEARKTSGLEPLGEDHAAAVAALVRARVRTRAARLGKLPEEIYNEQPLQIRDETAAEVAAAEAAIPKDAPRFEVPEVDLFGDPIEPQVTPRFAVENLATTEIPLANLVLSKEVPQFKHAADEKGVIVPLGGRFDRTGVGPIQVWERLDGTLEVISGRHRLDLARRSGEETIPAQIHREAEGFTARRAATLDAELNIREEQGSVADYAQYFKDSGITKEAADERGLLARAKGRTGFAIARDGSPDLIAAHRAGLLSDEAALSISMTAPQSERLQALGIAMVNEGKSILIAVNTMKAVDLMAAERMAKGSQGDIFGFDDSAMKEASKMAKLASSQQRKISEQIAAVAGASKRPELAKKMGVDVADPEGIQKRIVELRQEQTLWDNWPLHPELVARLRGPEVTGREGDLKQESVEAYVPPEFELKPETPAELAARNAEALAQAKRKMAEERAAELRAQGKKVTADQADLFNEQGSTTADAVLEHGSIAAAEALGGSLKALDNVMSKQAAFDLTPELRERALQGLPLFQEARASYNIAQKLITTLQKADKSSIVHELGHDWLEEMKADASRPDAPAQIKADWEMLRREFAIPEEGDIPRGSHEQAARSFERYLGEGTAPSAELRGVFARFKQWILEIYESLGNLRATVNPELRAIFDRMLATDAEIRDAQELGVPRAYVAEAKAQEARKIVPGFKAEQVALEPYADELPKGPGEAPGDSHVNYATIDGSTRIKLTLQRLAEIDQQNIQKHRSGKEGVETWEQEQATTERWILDTLGGGEDKLRLIRGGGQDDPKTNHMLRAKKQLMIGAGHASEKMRDIILQKGHNATIEEQLQYLSSIELLRQVHAEFLGERAAVARAMNALKDTTEGSAAINSMLEAIGRGQDSNTMFQSAAEKAMADQAMLKARLDEILLRYNGKSVLDIAKLHKEIGTLKGTFKLAETIEKATTWEMIVEGWKASLLSGPVTHTTNLFGTQAFMAMRAPVDVLASVIGMARGASPGMGESDRASMSEAVARLTGMLGGVKDGLQVAKATFDLDDPTGKTEAYRTAIPGRAGELIRIPLRLMGATDALNSTMYKRGELATLAIRQAFNEDLNPNTREFAERVAYLKDNPTPEMQVAADAAATRMTFNMPLGEKGVYLQLFVNKWNLQWMLPFVRTPINIMKEVGRMTPFAPVVGEWRAAMAKGGVERDRAIAEMALGSGIMALTMAYVFSGDISGGGDADPGKNRGKAGVWQPYSIKIGNTWYEYTRIEPAGTLMGMAADMATVWDHMNDEEKDKLPKLLSRAFANAVTNKTFLQGITNVVNAMSDPGRFAPSFLKQMAGSLVPNVIGQPTAMADPMVREVNSMLEAIQARIPGLRQDLLPKRDWLGKEMPSRERVAVIAPVRKLEISDDKVRTEAARLDISIADTPKKTHIGKGTGKLGDVELTPEERDKYAKIKGEMAHTILTNIVQSPGYDQIPDLVKRRIFSRVMTASSRVAAVQSLPMDKRIAHLQSISEKLAAELTAPE